MAASRPPFRPVVKQVRSGDMPGGRREAAGTSVCVIRLNQLHADCHRRIQYKKICPLHGEVSNDQIVSGYEYAQDHYVVVYGTSGQQGARNQEALIAMATRCPRGAGALGTNPVPGGRLAGQVR